MIKYPHLESDLKELKEWWRKTEELRGFPDRAEVIEIAWCASRRIMIENELKLREAEGE